MTPDPKLMPTEPQSLEEFLGYAYAVQTGAVPGQSLAGVAARARAKGFGQGVLEARRDALAQVEGRCIVSRAQRAFLDLVLVPEQAAPSIITP